VVPQVNETVMRLKCENSMMARVSASIPAKFGMNLSSRNGTFRVRLEKERKRSVACFRYLWWGVEPWRRWERLFFHCRGSESPYKSLRWRWLKAKSVSLFVGPNVLTW
jgi:hypothetical protein